MRMATHPLVFAAALCLLLFLPAGALEYRVRDWQQIPWSAITGLPNNCVKQIGARDAGMSYRILNKIGNVVYIGGNETLLKLHVSTESGELETEIIQGGFEKDEPSLIIQCDQQNDADPQEVCWNFIRVAEQLDGKLYVCGTNARSPLCYTCDTTQNSCVDVNSESDFNLVPHLPEDNPLTAVFARGNGTVLYGGNIRGETFQRSWINETGFSRLELDTVTVGSQFLDGPTFVGKPVEYENYVFLFYREFAMEYSSEGEKVYSRIARVCKNDTGGPVNTEKFVTFIKARLECSLPGPPFPYYLNEIQDVIWFEETKEFYAVFTSPKLGPKASAVCRYRMSDILKLFDFGESKQQKDGQVDAQWQPVLVTPRPGKCDEVHTTDYPTLMDKMVPNYNHVSEPNGVFQPIPPDNFIVSDPPTLYIEKVHFTSLAYDKDRCVFYFGTTGGTLFKSFKRNCNNPDEKFTTVELTDLSNYAVTDLELLNKTSSEKYLVITTKEEVLTLYTPESGCEDCWTLLETECAVKGPECVWQVNSQRCNSSASARLSVGSAEPRYLIHPQVDNVTSCDSKHVYLYCQVDENLSQDSNVNLTWTKDDDPNILENTHTLRLTSFSDRFLELRVRTIYNSTNGTYICTAKVNDDPPESKSVVVDVLSCLTEQSLQNRCNDYSQLKENQPSVENGRCTVETEDCNTCPRGYTTP